MNIFLVFNSFILSSLIISQNDINKEEREIKNLTPVEKGTWVCLILELCLFLNLAKFDFN
jgi:hypothetical protein